MKVQVLIKFSIHLNIFSKHAAQTKQHNFSSSIQFLCRFFFGCPANFSLNLVNKFDSNIPTFSIN